MESIITEAETAGVERLVSKVGKPKKDERNKEEIDENEEVNDASTGEDDVLDLKRATYL